MIIPVNIFSRECCTIERELVSIELFSQTSSFIHSTSSQFFLVGFQNEKKWLTGLLMIGLCPFDWFFLLWSFQIRNKVMNNTCYMFPLLLFFIAPVKLLQTFWFFQKLVLYCYYTNIFARTQQKNYLWKLWDTKQKNLFLTAYEEMLNWDNSFHSMSQFLNNLPDSFFFISSFFSSDHWNLTALFVDNEQVFSNNEPLLKCRKFAVASNKLQNTL